MLYLQECHCYRDFIAQENVPGLGSGKPRVNISAEMRRQIRKHTSSIVGRDTFALPVERKSILVNKLFEFFYNSSSSCLVR